MSLIEQAAQRLEQLRKAGADIPEDVSDSVPRTHAASGAGEPQPSHAPAREEAVKSPHPASAHAMAANAALSKFVNVDLDRLAAAGIIASNATRSQLADEFRLIKRPLIANALGRGAAPIRNGNLIMVTSALPGEGKSFTALNLAMSIAMEMDTTVMLVDADVARPSLLNMLSLPPAPGLLDVLLDDSRDLSSVLLRTSVEKLTILPSGTPHLRATEILASDAMARLLEDMASRYPDRIIIFDSPPLLLTTESRVLASHMGQIVMVVHAEKTLQSEVKQALAAIESCPVKLMLLNKARAPSSSGYGYGYGYGYGHES